jgi:hypothetical protein
MAIGPGMNGRCSMNVKMMEGVLNINGIAFTTLDETTRTQANIIANLSGLVDAYIKVHYE